MTAHAVFTAERNAREQHHLYLCLFPLDHVMTDTVFVGHREEQGSEIHPNYSVLLDASKTPTICTCRYFEKNAICKHLYMVMWEQEKAAEAAMLKELEEIEEGKEFMQACHAERDFLAAGGHAEAKCQHCDSWLFEDGYCQTCEERRLEYMIH